MYTHLKLHSSSEDLATKAVCTQHQVLLTLLTARYIVMLTVGTNKQEDIDLYTFEASKPADTGFLNGVAVNSTDEVLKSLLRADMQGNSWIAGWENHTENLPEDPTQVSHKQSFVQHAFKGNMQMQITQPFRFLPTYISDDTVSGICPHTFVCMCIPHWHCLAFLLADAVP